MKRPAMLWIIALALGWIFDFLFWKSSPGINFAIYTVLVLAGGFLVLLLNGFKPAWKSLLLVIPILFFAAVSFIRLEPLTMLLAFLLALGLLGLLTVSFLGGRWIHYSVADYVSGFARLAGSLIARPILFLIETRKAEAALAADGATPDRRAAWKRVWAIVRGLMIALPVIVILAALLASADLVFAQRLNDFIRLFRLENLPQYLFRLAYILLGSYALAGAYLHAARKSSDEKLFAEKPFISQFLGFTEAAVVLCAVIVLFGLFVIVQFRYFFGGVTNIGLQGYTYAEYARRGFGELVGVAFISLLLFLGLSTIAKRQTIIQRRLFSGLGVGMVALVGVILVSAFQRLMLYESAYGFSRLRIYTHVFMVWLGLILAVVVVLELMRRERFFPLAALLAAIGFTASLALINVDASIVNQNVRRAASGQPLDVAYLASLSTDSVPALVQAYQSTSLRSDIRESAGAALACQAALRSANSSPDWRAFTLSRFQAQISLRTVQTSLGRYVADKNVYPVTVKSPQGKKFNCSPDPYAD